jgi:hypothetical protein
VGLRTHDQPSSSTRYQWRELYAAWRLAIPSPNLQQILVFPQKGQPFIQPMDSVNWIIRLKELAEYCKHDVFLCEEIFRRLGHRNTHQRVATYRHDAQDVHTTQLELDSKMLIKALTEEGKT